MQSVQIVSGILTPLLSNGVIPANDVSMIKYSPFIYFNF